MSPARKSQVLPPPRALPALGPLVIVEGDCSYFPEESRSSTTAFALPGSLSAQGYQTAMSLGMRRSGTLVYRPICAGCRRCQPFRLAVERFSPSRSQKRVQKKADGHFIVDVVRPALDVEHLDLYARYQAHQHGKDGQSADEEGYARFLIDTVADTWELAWRDATGALVAVGIIDVVDDGISTVYFYWDPRLQDFSLGVYSALWEIDLCRRWNKPYYYMGFLVPGSRTMSYKSQYAGGEVWTGEAWSSVPGRDLDDPLMLEALQGAARLSMVTDAVNFPVVRRGQIHEIP